ncbi:uncharacterized protein LAJ45_11327 [Morchella importuna]|uniref:uncharacterized protein n=1 Tax=Morchella importuna TaxID=1174673 RepID=UPI001E8D9B77|nr:uncharacterized protein LAJ45_11327 [Morchella importuna]KAH8144666.1 hypothetical protein LAJ45_11327 [Morchella importuna]
MAEPSPLLSVPPEIIYLISDFLTVRRAAFFARTCHAIHAALASKLDQTFLSTWYKRPLWAAQKNRPYTLEHWSNVDAYLLNEAICNTSPDAVRLLLARGVDPNGTTKEMREQGRPPLTTAVRQQHVPIVTMLLEAGADARYHPGHFAMRSAILQAYLDDNMEIGELLVKYGAEIPLFSESSESDSESCTSGEDD